MLPELKKPYQGEPPRPWLPVQLMNRRGHSVELHAVVDTGCPFPIVIREKLLGRCRVRDAMLATTNFGLLDSGWAEVRVPELRFAREILVYGSDHVVDVLARSSRKFTALLGLPFLRMFEYGGDERDFWLRPGSESGLG
jgi:hypothetical protein